MKTATRENTQVRVQKFEAKFFQFFIYRESYFQQFR